MRRDHFQCSSSNFCGTSSTKRTSKHEISYFESMTFKLILLRHGQSTWNASNLFTGWVDVPLSNKGLQEARNAGLCLAESGILPEVLHTSFLRRAINTASIALDVADRHWIPVKRSWCLNERHYGRLQGENKDNAADTFGAEQVRLWRRSYDVSPPAIQDDFDTRPLEPRYYVNGSYVIPETECLRDVMERMGPYWLSDIVPDLKSGQTVLIVAHGNSLRALIKLLDNLSDKEMLEKEIPTGIPIFYELGHEFKSTIRGGKLLN